MAETEGRTGGAVASRGRSATARKGPRWSAVVGSASAAIFGRVSKTGQTFAPSSRRTSRPCMIHGPRRPAHVPRHETTAPVSPALKHKPKTQTPPRAPRRTARRAGPRTRPGRRGVSLCGLCPLFAPGARRAAGRHAARTGRALKLGVAGVCAGRRRQASRLAAGSRRGTPPAVAASPRRKQKPGNRSPGRSPPIAIPDEATRREDRLT